eukprot:TRINITY_DN56374_c0_g1_i1.p1 TRINITY_DN56374_c0_g1~~TRINITY_DN56374_c0_g1_i1.p1  ORF type:complete len:676 (+),score=126.05 TRINITY_DN56374_c0_g1_i1:196-2223(+)
MAVVGGQSLHSSHQSEASNNDFVEGRLLDGFLLLAAGGSSSPDEVVSANLTSLQLVDVAVEDLAFFVNLDRLDASDNQLSYEQVLHQMGRLPRLTSLVLACNSIASLQVSAGTLRKLETLDLSFNELHGDVLATLAHLSGLVKLNLSSNCISSIPPEEDLYGLHALEELNLDANDLVQFVQWRALDALPRLRKLSLVSNRVKRLKDDAPDVPGGSQEIAYFPQLEDLNLSSNEIAGVDCLPVVRVFRSLRTLTLSDNPCSRGQQPLLATGDPSLPGVKLVAEVAKPFYLRGSGCHHRKKQIEPRLKFDKKTMRKVFSSPQVGGNRAGRRQGAASQLGVLDMEANQLLVSLRRDEGSWLSGPAPTTMSSAPKRTGPVVVTCGQDGVPTAPPGLLTDDLSEEELDQIFRERRMNIDRRFAMEVDEPASFMRPPPFVVSAAAGQKLNISQNKQIEEEEETSQATVKRPSSSAAFLTSVGDDSAELLSRPAPVISSTASIGGGSTNLAGYGSHSREASRPFGSARSAMLAIAAGGQTRSQPSLQQPAHAGQTAPAGAAAEGGSVSGGGCGGAGGTSGASAAFAAMLDTSLPAASQGAHSLPPIGTAGSRGSSAGGSAAGASTGRVAAVGAGKTDLQLPPARGGVGASMGNKQRPVADIGVREALKALRAASMSEYAVAA